MTTITAAQFSTAQAGLLQAQAYRSLKAYLSNYLSQYSVSLTEWAFLGLLVLAPLGTRPSELSLKLQVELPLVTSLANRLSEQNYIKRVKDPQDGRAKLINLTESGKDFVSRLELQLRADMKRFLDDVSPEELAIYLSVLSKIAAKQA